MRTFDGLDTQLLSGDGVALVNGVPVNVIARDVDLVKTLREDLDFEDGYSWFDRSSGLRLFDAAGNLFKFDISSAEYAETVIAAHGLYISDSTPLTSTLDIRDVLVDENLNASAGYSFSGNRAFGLELNNATELTGLRIRIKTGTSSVLPDQWAAGSSGTFVAYQSNDNNTWTQIKSFTVDDSDNLNRYITDGELGYCYLDFWFNQAVTAKYFKIFTATSFQVSDGSTNTLMYPCEVLGYVMPSDSLASLRNGSFFTGNSPIMDAYTTLSAYGGTTLYNDVSCSGIGSEWADGYSLGLSLSKIAEVSTITIYAVNYTGGDNFEPDHFITGNSFNIYRSFDNIHWDTIATSESESYLSSVQSNCGEFGIDFGGSYLGKYFIVVPDSDTPRWEDMGSSYNDTLNPAEVYLN